MMPPIDFTPPNTSPLGRSHKRKATSSSDDRISDIVLETPAAFSEREDTPVVTKKTKVKEVPLIAVQPPPLAFPKSLYAGYVPPAPPVSEKSVLHDIIAEENQAQNNLGTLEHNDDDSFIDAELEDFVIYREHRTFTRKRQKSVAEAPRSSELVSLHEINEWNVQRFYLDGTIWHGGERSYVQKVPFEILSIGGYGEIDSPVVDPDIWIQTVEGKRQDIWYRLRKPASEYARFHEPFLWMAQFAKHVVDFLTTHELVILDDFRSAFFRWLKGIYGSDKLVCLWLGHYNKEDFRQAIASQANFLWCQATQVDGNLGHHPVWSECHARFLNAIPEEKERCARSEMFISSKDGDQTIPKRKTTVTPYVFRCFEHLPWAKFLYCQVPSVGRFTSRKKDRSARTGHRGEVEELDLLNPNPQHTNSYSPINIGDVVALPPDKITTWKSTDKDWLGYVQGIKDTPDGRELGLLWLYRPSDTQCLRVPYPWARELFLSDHCNCGDSPIYCQEVIRKLKIAFFGEPATKGVDFFVRQRYLEADAAWQTLQDTHSICSCGKPKPESRYPKGKTLLVSIDKVLEPVVIVHYERDDKVKVRRLLRRRRDYHESTAEPNELILTNRYEIISVRDICRECQIRFYTTEQREQSTIPAPYNRGGMGDFYFIILQDLRGNQPGLQPVETPQVTPMIQGWDPRVPVQPPMKGLDIFCGGGNFGRGLEEGGAVHFNWAVDWYTEAIHTYKANLKPGDTTHLFYGSVNHYLTQAMQGIGGGNVAQYGDVEVLAAGSPCQGFSNANPNRGTDRSLMNISMVASVVAFIDFYRPKYALLENVKGMASGPDTENVLALVISAIVGMGYQVRTFALDAWNYGSAQSRSRVFISIAAPGLTPLPEPPHTHSHPENVRSASLGKLANGLRSSSRYMSQTAFKYTTAAEATSDLPATDDRTSCVAFPDHRMSIQLSTLHRVQISSIPRFPRGNTFVLAAKDGYMPQAQIDAFDWSNTIRSKLGARGWQRVKRGALIPTVMTEARPGDGTNGTVLHWDEERLLTVMEVRRAQGFLDHEVLLGVPREQWKIVGNSVARPVALALGVSLREAWLSNNALLESIQATKSANDGIYVIVHPSTSPVSNISNGKHDLLSTSPNNCGHGYRSSRMPDERFESIGRSEEEIEDSSISIQEDDQPHKYINARKTSFSDAKGHPKHTTYTTESSTRRSSKSMAPSNSPPTRLVARETMISKVTITTTTTILRGQVESSPEL